MTDNARLVSYVYLATCAVPYLCLAAGIVWASKKHGFDAWGIVAFLLAGGAFGVINLIAGLFVIARRDVSKSIKVLTWIGFFLGGVLPAWYLLFLLNQ